MKLTQAQRISRIKGTTLKLLENRKSFNTSRAKSNLWQERIQQAELLEKCGIEKNEALQMMKDEQSFDNDLTFAMLQSIKERQKQSLQQSKLQ